jgi:methylmalonyl-CoA/ethylmalonyl-CoA epimerase
MDLPLSFHHVGIACRSIDKTVGFYLAMGYTASPVTDDPLQHVKVCFLERPGQPRLELLEPLDDVSPVARTLATAGVTPYHLCYEVQDIDAAVAMLRGQRFLLVSGPVHACAMGGRRVAFLFKKDNGLLELVEAER